MNDLIWQNGRSKQCNFMFSSPKLTVLPLQTCQIWFCVKHTASLRTAARQGRGGGQWLCLHVQQYSLKLLRLSVHVLDQVKPCVQWPGKIIIVEFERPECDCWNMLILCETFHSFNGRSLPILILQDCFMCTEMFVIWITVSSCKNHLTRTQANAQDMCACKHSL